MSRRKKIFWAAVAVVVFVLAVQVLTRQSRRAGVRGNKVRLIAIPAASADVRGPVSYLFGRAPYFILCDRVSKTYQAIPNPYMDAMHAAGLKSSEMLVKKQVDAVCGNNIGFEPSRTFQAAGIAVYTGIKPTVLETLAVFPDGLAKIDQQNVPSHFGITGSKIPIACKSFDVGANLAQIVQGKFYVCFQCGYRISETALAGAKPSVCPQCGQPLHEVVAVTSPAETAGTPLKVKVV
jgi:predicted Fe-Mo cluster-binding NifX family protein